MAKRDNGPDLDAPIPYRVAPPPLEGRRVTTGAVLVAVRCGWAASGRPPTLRELADQLSVQPTTLLRHLDELERTRLIERERADRRVTAVWPAGLRTRLRAVATEFGG
jgi:DNA-binding transcriptional ArsR family regulator